MLKAFKSKTIMFMAIMGGLDAVVANIHYAEKLLTPEQFSYVLLGLLFITKAGGVVLRYLTVEPMSNK